MKLASLLLLAALVAQAPKMPPARPDNPVEALAAIDIVQKTPTSPEPLSQVEKLRVENLKLERVILQRSVADWQTKAMALKADMEKSRPGFTWNPDEDTWAPLPKEKK